MSRYEARFGTDEWYEVADGPQTHAEAAQVFADFLINQEWKRYDLVHAERLAKEQITVRDGDDYRLFVASRLKLRLYVEIQSACTDSG